jgi:membrane protein DedA with SNARE-associated domain
MEYGIKMKTARRILLLALLLIIAASAGLFYGYQRGYDHGEKITNKWWIDQQSRYYDAAEVAKKRRALELDTI